MKKYIFILLATAVLTMTGCGAQNQMMMDEMKAQMDSLQFQVNSAETAAARAKDMAEEALIKASKNHSMMRKMHGGSMMK